MTKHNKKYYQRHEKNQPTIVLTGEVYLKFRDSAQIETAKKGDLMCFPSVEALIMAGEEGYFSTGEVGYFRVDVYDGKEWRPVLLLDLFPGREHHFGKKECPIDTFEICLELLQAMKGRTLVRTYREHYTLVE